MHARAFLLAASFALLSVASLFMYTKKLRTEVSGGEKISIVIVTKAVKKGTLLADEHVAVRGVPAAYVDDRFVRASDRVKVLGVRADRDLEPQQTLSWTDLALAGDADRHLSQLVQPGTRALTLHIPAAYMSVELLRPGDYVDLLGLIDEQHGNPQAVVLLQKVLVLAVGVETRPTRENRGNQVPAQRDQLLTISVTLQESQTVALAAQKGPVIAVLRSAEDPSIATKVPALSQVVIREPATAKLAPNVATKPEKLTPAPYKTEYRPE